MLPRSSRLPARTRLSRTTTIHTNFGIIKKANNDIGISRLGVVVAKKVAKTAVDRNSIRRKLHTCFADLFATVPPGHDYLVIIHKNIADLSSGEILTELRNKL